MDNMLVQVPSSNPASEMLEDPEVRVWFAPCPIPVEESLDFYGEQELASPKAPVLTPNEEKVMAAVHNAIAADERNAQFAEQARLRAERKAQERRLKKASKSEKPPKPEKVKVPQPATVTETVITKKEDEPVKHVKVTQPEVKPAAVEVTADIKKEDKPMPTDPGAVLLHIQAISAETTTHLAQKKEVKLERMREDLNRSLALQQRQTPVSVLQKMLDDAKNVAQQHQELVAAFAIDPDAKDEVQQWTAVMTKAMDTIEIVQASIRESHALARHIQVLQTTIERDTERLRLLAKVNSSVTVAEAPVVVEKTVVAKVTVERPATVREEVKKPEPVKVAPTPVKPEPKRVPDEKLDEVLAIASKTKFERVSEAEAFFNRAKHVVKPENHAWLANRAEAFVEQVAERIRNKAEVESWMDEAPDNNAEEGFVEEAKSEQPAKEIVTEEPKSEVTVQPEKKDEEPKWLFRKSDGYETRNGQWQSKKSRTHKSDKLARKQAGSKSYSSAKRRG